MVPLYMGNCLVAIMWHEVPVEGDAGTYPSHQRCCAATLWVRQNERRSVSTRVSGTRAAQDLMLVTFCVCCSGLHKGVGHQGGASAPTPLNTAPAPTRAGTPNEICNSLLVHGIVSLGLKSLLRD